MDERHTLFQLVKLPASETVGQVAQRYSMKVETLWMPVLNLNLNAGPLGRDPTDQLPPSELTDHALHFNTLPLKYLLRVVSPCHGFVRLCPYCVSGSG